MVNNHVVENIFDKTIWLTILLKIYSTKPYGYHMVENIFSKIIWLTTYFSRPIWFKVRSQ